MAARACRWPLITMSRPDTTDERDREPQHDVVDRGPLVGRRQQHDAHRDELHERLPLAEAPRRQRHAVAGGVRAVHRDADLAHGHDQHRGPREVAGDAEGEEAAEHEELVGERVEERTRAGGAVASGEPAVEPVGGGEHEPQRHGEPARALVDDEQQGGHGEDEPGDGDDVGGGGDGLVAVATHPARRGCAHGDALMTAAFATSGSALERLGHEIRPDRLGDVRTHEGARGGRTSAWSRTMPSISGASRCVRPMATR